MFLNFSHMARELFMERGHVMSLIQRRPWNWGKSLFSPDPRPTLTTLHLTLLNLHDDLICSDVMLKNISFLLIQKSNEMTLSWIKKPDWTLYYWETTCVWACVFLNLMLSCCLCICLYACLRVCLRACVCALCRSRCCSCSGATRRCPSRLTWSCSRGCGMSCWNSSWWNISGAHRAWSWSPCPSSLPPDTLNMVWIQLWLSVLPVLFSAYVAPDSFGCVIVSV